MAYSEIKDFILRVSNRSFVKKFPAFYDEFKKFKHLSTKNKRFSLNTSDIYPCMEDRTTLTGFDRHYIFHPAWAARVVKKINPDFHIDISSTLTFCTILSAFVPVKFYDYRPAPLNLSNLDSLQGDLHNLPFSDESVSSLSCMHVIEHIGLGRYGEPLDPDGDLKSIIELKRVLKKGGNLLFVTPIGGKAKIMFNAHRIYTFNQIIEYYKDFTLREFALVPDNPADGGLILNATQEMANAQHYGCGCFWFTK
jgi:SAM-dependent methyltransferase